MCVDSMRKLRLFKILLASVLISLPAVSNAKEFVAAKKRAESGDLPSTSAVNELGIATWQPISKSHTQVSLLGSKEGEIQSRRAYIALDNYTVYAEGLVLDNGTIFYRRDRSILPTLEDTAGRLAKINQYISYAGEKEMALLGVSGLPSVKHHADVDKEGKYLLTTASGESAKAQCVSFYKAATKLEQDTLSRSAIGVFCFPKNGGVSLNQRVENVASLASRLEFDDGEHARSTELKGVTREVHKYWASQDFSPPKVSLTSAQYLANGKEFFFSGKVEDKSGFGFIKINGERLSESSFKQIAKSDGSFKVYARSNSAIPIKDVNLIVGDKVGNITRLGTKSPVFRKVTRVAINNSNLKPIILRSKVVVKPKTYVLLAGISKYQSPKLPPLRSPLFDVTRIEKMFRQKLKIPKSQIFLEKNISKADFKNKIEEIRQSFNYKDQLIVYYSGHGIVDLEEGTKDGYWAFSDTSAAEPKTWLSNNEMKNLLSGFSDGGVFLLVDSCFSGRLVSGNVISATSFESLKQRMSFNSPERSRLALTSAGEFPTPDTSNNSSHSEFALAIIKSLDISLTKAAEKNLSNLPGSLVYLYANLELKDKFQAEPQFGSFSKDLDLDGSKVPDILLNLK